MSEQWNVPAGLAGDADLVRISASGTDDEGDKCAEFLAAKARPKVQPRPPFNDPKSRYDTFALGKVMDVLDRHEFDGITVDTAMAPVLADQRLHAGAQRWIRHAVESYLISGAAGDDEPLVAVAGPWVVQKRVKRLWELYAWGRRYESMDGTLREFRFLRLGVAAAERRPDGQTAIAAYTTAAGDPADGSTRWFEPFNLLASPPVERIRVVEIGLLDGSRVVLFEGSTEEALALFAEHGRPLMKRTEAGGTRIPGDYCLGCKQRLSCPALPKTPGLLSVPGPRGPLRSWSATDGRDYDKCPARQHMRQLKLPRAAEYSPEAVRGQAVHAHLEAAHRRMPSRPCRREDLPPLADDWSAGGWSLTGDDAFDGHRMLGQHLQTCPLQHARYVSDIQVERTVPFYDTSANVLVIAQPDLLYTDGSGQVWRETKTTHRHRSTGADIVRWYPQLALGVLILSSNLLGGPGEHRIELETLTPESANIELIDVHDPAIIATAREVITGYVTDWHRDDVATTRPGPHCQSCPARRWCPDGPIDLDPADLTARA